MYIDKKLLSGGLWEDVAEDNDYKMREFFG